MLTPCWRFDKCRGFRPAERAGQRRKAPSEREGSVDPRVPRPHDDNRSASTTPGWRCGAPVLIIVQERLRVYKAALAARRWRGLDTRGALLFVGNYRNAGRPDQLCVSIARTRSGASTAHDCATSSDGTSTPAARTAICGPAARASVK